MRVALYLRRSTNERLQADSLRTQEEILRAYADAHEMDVVKVYKDSASGTTSKHRHAFLSMAETITHGANFQAILVRDVTRFGRFYDPDEGAFWEMLFLGHQVKTVYVEEVFGSDTTPMASLLKGVRRIMAAEYSRDKSRMVRRGQSRVTRLGFLGGGPPPYGMRRVMVTLQGDYIQDLSRGQWKGLSSCRTKLLPGREEEVTVVNKIFNLYVSDALSFTAIADRLNVDGVPAPGGSRWFAPTISQILQNPRYAGKGSYKTRWKSSGDTLSRQAASDLDVIRDDSYENIVSKEVWDLAQARMRSVTRRRSDLDLASDLRKAYEAVGRVEQTMLKDVPGSCSWASYSIRFANADEALRLSFSSEISTRTDDLLRDLSESFTIERSGQEVLLNGTFRILVQPVFLHRTRWRDHWKLFRSQGEHDAVLAFGIRPDGNTTDEAAVIRRTRIDAKQRGLQIDLDGRATSRVAVDLRKLMRGFNAGTEATFREAAVKMSAMNLSEIARRLGWPHHAARRIYWRLINRGEHLPPMQKKAGRLVEIVCLGCGRSSWECPSRALALRSNLCFSCTRKRPRHKVKICCPSCGREDERWPSAVKQLSDGANTVCRKCRIVEAGERHRVGRTDEVEKNSEP
jgi:DNA invertase Pin-like site-specific DNA recombinase